MNDKDLFQFMGDIRASIGRIEANQESHLSYLDAVNGNVKEIRKDFADHISDDAIKLGSIRESIGQIVVGENSRGQVWGMIGKVLAGFSALTAVALGIRAVFGPK